jgi:hypothetical protein
MLKPETFPTAQPLPIEALKQVLEDAGPEVQKLFVTALNIFAGPYAANQTYADKKAGLECLTCGQRVPDQHHVPCATKSPIC